MYKWADRPSCSAKYSQFSISDNLDSNDGKPFFFAIICVYIFVGVDDSGREVVVAVINDGGKMILSVMFGSG